MAAIIGVLCLCSSSASAGSFVGGIIPGTQPHLIKEIGGDHIKSLVDWIRPTLTKLKTKYPELSNSSNATEERLKDDVKDLDKAKCDDLRSLLAFAGEKMDAPKGSDTVFTLGGSIDNKKAILDYLELTMEDLRVILRMCIVRIEMTS